MQKRTKFLGAACGFAAAALMANPAAAASPMGFVGTVDTDYTRTNIEHCHSCNTNAWTFGGVIGGSLADLKDINIQVGASYTDIWRNHFSAESWNFGGDVFWAGQESRFGIDGHYTHMTHFGYDASAGIFGEWYLGDITVAAKGGWTQDGGSGNGGDGNYFGTFASFYPVPELAITGGFNWSQENSGLGCPTCGNTGFRVRTFGLEGEYGLPENLLAGLAIYARFAYSQEHSSLFNANANDTAFTVGLRWYTGGGNIEMNHRNGNLHPWLPGR